MAHRTLVDHEDVREWAAQHRAQPAMQRAVPSIGMNQPVLSFAFGQHAYQDQDQGSDRAPATGTRELVEWDEWLGEFDRLQLALLVTDEAAGETNDSHQFARRDEAEGNPSG